MITRTIRNASYLGAVVVAGLAMAGGSVAMWRSSVIPPRPGLMAGPTVAMPKAISAPAAPEPQSTAHSDPAPVPEFRPAFDIVRIEPSGEAVIAGHAAANVAVQLLSEGKVIANARSDGAGQFVILPSALAPGGHRLGLTAPSANGGTTLSSEAVAINVAGSDRKIAAISAPNSSPDGVTGSPGRPSTSTVSSAGAPPISSEVGAKDPKKTKVVRGDSLWSISTHLLGGGEHYPEIRTANSAQIRNPQLIYPGQILLVPSNAPSQ
jgi:nucleoid-associated protein YgaU